MGAPNYITDDKGNIVYPRTLAKCVKKGGTTLDDYLDKVEDNLLIKPTAQGTDIQLKDSSDMNIQELHVYGRTEQASTTGANLFDVNDRLSFNSIFKVDEERYITATIPANNTEDYQYYNFFTKKSDLLKIDTEYLIVTEILEIPTEKCQINIISLEQITKGQFANAVAKTIKGIKFDKAKTRNDMSGCVAMLRGFMLTQPGFTGGKIKFRVSVLEDTTITADTFKYEPYTGGMPSPNPDYPQEIVSVEKPSVIVTGKNLAITQNVRGSNNLVNAKIVRGQKYTLSFDCNKRVAMNVNSKSQAGKTLININPLKIGRNSCSFIAIDDGDIFFNCYGSTDNTNYLQINNIQIERGDTSSDYEPYKQIQTVTFNHSLNGIDDVKDELIIRADGTGQLIQRLAKKIMDGSNIDASASGQQEGSYLVNIETVSDMLTGNYNVGLSTICSNKRSGKEKNTIRFGANNKNVYLYLDESFAGKTPTELRKYFVENPFTIVYPLEKPIVTNLSAEEVQKILNLHTNKTNTTIWNDQDAEMQVTYVADTKKYIDDKFEELSEAITTSTTINSLDTSN